jgi:hypothetical protein
VAGKLPRRGPTRLRRDRFTTRPRQWVSQFTRGLAFIGARSLGFITAPSTGVIAIGAENSDLPGGRIDL